MRRPIVLSGSLLPFVAISLVACASARRAPVPAIPSVAVAEPCATDVDGVSVKGWQQVHADGLSFCVPASWRLDKRYERTIARLRSSGYASFSWAAPDTLQRVIIQIPHAGFAVTQLKDGLALCMRLGIRERTIREIGGRDVCVAYTGRGLSSGVTISYPEPLVRVQAIGTEDAFTVAQTVRPLKAASR